MISFWLNLERHCSVLLNFQKPALTANFLYSLFPVLPVFTLYFFLSLSFIICSSHVIKLLKALKVSPCTASAAPSFFDTFHLIVIPLNVFSNFPCNHWRIGYFVLNDSFPNIWIFSRSRSIQIFCIDFNLIVLWSENTSFKISQF